MISNASMEVQIRAKAAQIERSAILRKIRRLKRDTIGAPWKALPALEMWILERAERLRIERRRKRFCVKPPNSGGSEGSKR